MSRLVLSRLLLLFVVLVSSAQVALAQASSLINPGFDGPFVSTEAGLVAEGWTAWASDPSAAANPTVAVRPDFSEAAGNDARILTGDNAQVLSTFFATFEGGVYQQVPDAPVGVDVTFSVFAYVWSSSFDDVNVSEGDGDVTVEVGIDPTGGTDPASDAIVWSAPVEAYDEYVLHTVTAQPAASSITVYVRAVVGLPVKDTFVYLDDASLDVASASADATITPTATVLADDAATEAVDAPTEVSVSVPTETPLPTDVPATSTVAPTDVPATATGVSTAIPTVTPLPTDVPPTSTVAPTDVPATATVLPTQTPIPTITPVPTATRGGAVAAVVETAAARPLSDEFPSSIVVTVRPGDTVANIAARNNSTVEAIRVANGLANASLIFVGQQLVVPVRGEQSVVPLPAPITATPLPSSTMTPTATLPTDTVTYVVRPGDTLAGVAARYNTTVATLAQLNGIVNVNRLLVGQVLLVPRPTEDTMPGVPTERYVVQRGDTLYAIALRYRATLDELIILNRLANPNRLFVGQVLMVPSGR